MCFDKAVLLHDQKAKKFLGGPVPVAAAFVENGVTNKQVPAPKCVDLHPNNQPS